MDDQDWDVSVRAVAHYPTVIGMMADKIDWTTSVGQAYVNQSTDVASSVQNLRHLARNAGNLQSSQQQEVIEHDNYIAISPYQPEYIYVPVYDPAIIYYRRPYYGPAITFGVGFPIGAWLNLDFRWGYGGGWGGVYYTGWRQGGWGGGCWNCGWINRSRGRVNYSNSVYVNNRYNNIRVNRNCRQSHQMLEQFRNSVTGNAFHYNNVRSTILAPIAATMGPTDGPGTRPAATDTTGEPRMPREIPQEIVDTTTGQQFARRQWTWKRVCQSTSNLARLQWPALYATRPQRSSCSSQQNHRSKYRPQQPPNRSVPRPRQYQSQ